MTQVNDPILGIHGTALKVWTRRNEVLAANIANADTPNYKARDINFAATLGRMQHRTLNMKTTHTGHQTMNGATSNSMSTGDLLYRVPNQPSLDGNSVEADVEQAKFGENSLRYQASLMFISSKVRKMRAAISGSHQ